MMKFLCFHGATTNSEHFKNVIYHLRKNLEADATASFHFIEGLYEIDTLSDVKYECAPPNLHHFDYPAVDFDLGYSHLANTLTDKDMTSPEDGARRALYRMYGQSSSVAGLMLEYARNVVEEEGPFDGVIGASEGAGAAATVLFDQLELARESGNACAMKCGIFFVGIPPFRPDGKTMLLCDESNDRITVPTCHVLSEKDELDWLSYACANVCQDQGKTFVLHEGGHVIPHAEALMVDVAEFVRRIQKGMNDEKSRVVHNAATA